VRSSGIELQELRHALERNQALTAVHYACESFFTAKDHPAGIACVALYDLQTDETRAYSRSDAPPSVAGDAREVHLLERYYNELAARSEAGFLHWNMNRPEYGFTALANRYEYLTSGPPPVTIPERRFDLDGLLAAQFGDDYAPHGKLESTARLNSLDTRSFRNGKTEAELFAKGDWIALSRSAASKAKIIAQLLILLVEGTIRTAGSAGTVTFAGARLDSVPLVLALGDRMLLVQRSLRVRPHGKAALKFEDEYDDQYLYRALLVQFFDDVRDEEYTPSYAGKNSRIDFLLPAYSLAIELKHTRDGLRDADLGEQLIVDRDRYSSHPSVTHLICLVFDYDGQLRNPRALEEDLRRATSTADIAVTVRIYDR
jgi:hypothetical protein